MPVTILGAMFGKTRSDSQIVYDAVQAARMPEGVFETDPYQERISTTEAMVARHYWCPWSLRVSFTQWVLGYSYSLAAGPAPGVGTLRRVPPAQDPERPWLYAQEAEIVERAGAWVLNPNNPVLGPDGNQVGNTVAPCLAYVDNSEGAAGAVAVEPFPNPGAIDHNLIGEQNYRDGWVKYKVTFRPRDYTILSDELFQITGKSEVARWVSYREKWGLEALPMARVAAAGPQQLKFAQIPVDVLPASIDPPAAILGSIVPEPGVRLYPIAHITLVWHEVPDRNLTTYLAALGTVNKLPFSAGRGTPTFRPYTLLLKPWETREVIGETGRICWDITFTMAYRAATWVAYPAGDGGTYYATFGGRSTDPTVYEATDWSNLFTVPSPPVNYLA